ncbi:exopolyphosphatase Ecym_5146 [Eremothecium cymbalariae DBVPG|uniref:DHHA2 domain-containing protein n=1 Tax=Eremothecium cymbalariae (strain CBS 270.75 / DBVPG 7215 / KCTC 17166 / NRRL Y-17582) TaxID=931890 RepID=I6NCY1_ERECY|nr:hypothetical protein Ecym_5146 [Eremothecium cymbalariae DBVPG\
MVKSICSFMTLLRDASLKGLMNGTKIIKIVCGNESADIDSVACAIAYAYLSYDNDQRDTYIPVINIPREDLKLRRDVVFMLESISVSLDSLFFIDEIRKMKLDNIRVESVLVDHNDLTGVAREVVDNVIGIIDHHEDNNMHKESIKRANGPRIIEPAGSCSSLVFNYWLNNLGIQRLKPLTDISKLFLSALLMDTVNMKYKVTKLDPEAYSNYVDFLQGMDFEHYYETLVAKKDIDGLPIEGILAKDYKQFSFSSHHGVVKVGTSSIPRPLQWILEQHGNDEFVLQSRKYIIKKNLDLLLLVHHWISADVHYRQFVVVVDNDKSMELSAKIIQAIKDELQLEKVEIIVPLVDGILTYNQLALNKSRKTVVPLIRKAVEEL